MQLCNQKFPSQVAVFKMCEYCFLDMIFHVLIEVRKIASA